MISSFLSFWLNCFWLLLFCISWVSLHVYLCMCIYLFLSFFLFVVSMSFLLACGVDYAYHFHSLEEDDWRKRKMYNYWKLYTEMVSACQNTKTCDWERKKVACKLGDNIFICMYWDDSPMKIMQFWQVFVWCYSWCFWIWLGLLTVIYYIFTIKSYSNFCNFFLYFFFQHITYIECHFSIRVTN